MTRIIAGTARGRRLAVPPTGTRPTSDRVREALFSSVDSELIAGGRSWQGLTVLDLFAGSGALGLEALSRGAGSAILVEKSRAAAKVASANVVAVGLPGAQVLIRDAWSLASMPPPSGGVDLCFADPPYEWPSNDIRSLLSELAGASWFDSQARVVIERPAKEASHPFPAHWIERSRRSYGDTVLWYGQVALERVDDLEEPT